MEVPAGLRTSIRRFGELGRWERAELGRSLRRLGLSYGEIQRLIPVPKGTLAGWCRDITLTDVQIAAIKDRCGPAAGPRNTQWKRREEVTRIKAEAAEFARGHLTDPFWVAGTVLYWGEGSKTQRAHALANADAAALRLFINWTLEYVNPAAVFVLKLNLHSDNDDDEAKAYWQEALGMPDAEFYRTFIKPDGTGHRKNHLPYGVCQVRMRRSADAAVRVEQWIAIVAKHFAAKPSFIANLPTGR
ncbi:MAG: hypothetical protein HKN74_01760 [Acidimicrobiia bacterium]|nr:hypothetical protein [Acidimicrobiia bacterium]MBT8216329.1 hypothetical protein [Acidimicrobiia bacterium]NNF08987.1 hypothetical protein [Acidimicrobiia bacterium]NNL71536.1 hypothetical protein [Acidimicrobiia bacterium]